MTYEKLYKQLDSYIKTPVSFRLDLNNYHYTARPSAKIILSDSLIDREPEALNILYYCEEGWFKQAHGSGSMKLMLAARALGLIHDDFYRYDINKYNQIYEIAKDMSDDAVELICKAYAKQKIVTCRALSMIREKRPEITLYRGISNEAYDGYSKEIYFNGLESYTSNLRMAKFFAGKNGWIIKRECSIFEIFVYYTTLYRKTHIPKEEMKYKIHRAREYIVENKMPIRVLSNRLRIDRSDYYE